MGSGLFSFPGGHFGVGRFARGKGTQSYEARFSPSRSPFPGTSLFCVVVCYNVLENACMLLYWPCTAVPMGIHRTEGGLHSRPVPGNCYIAGAHLLLPVVVFLVLTCFCLLAYCWCLPASACWRITGIDLLLPTTGNRPAARAAFPSGGTKKSAQPDTIDTAAYRTKPINLHSPRRSTVACPEGWGVGRGNGLRNSECLPSPRISPLFQSRTFFTKNPTTL